MQWSEVLADPSLRNLPYKIELNARGVIEMSPARNRHAILQGRLISMLQRLLPGGTSFPECAVQTRIGVRVPDVVWTSAAFLARQGDADPFPEAPEICVEVLSPSNGRVEIAEKIEAYLEAGAGEVWIVGLQGDVEFHTTSGRLPDSRIIPGFSLGQLSQLPGHQ